MRHRGQRISLPPSEVELVRAELLAYCEKTGTNIRQVAARCGLPAGAVYDFVGYRYHSVRTIREIVRHLPLGLTLDPPRIRRSNP